MSRRPVPPTLAMRFKRERKRLAMSQAEAAEHCYVPASTLRGWEHGRGGNSARAVDAVRVLEAATLGWRAP